MAIICGKTTCKHNKFIEFTKTHICKRGQGYDYPGGNITVNKFGRCISAEKIPANPNK